MSDSSPFEPGHRFAEPSHWPAVSVVVPVRDMADRLRERVIDLAAQDYDGDIEIVIAVMPSRDETEQIAMALERDTTSVAVIRVPTTDIATALTTAVYAAQHSVIVRAGQRGVLPPDYVSRAVKILLGTGAACVGGTQRPIGDGPLREAEARAMTSRIGVGGARFHVGGAAGATRSVYLGAYRRSVIERLGGFDPRFGVAYDWELNYRIRRSGGLIWFDPGLQVGYETHRSVGGLLRGYWRTGWARRSVVRAYPDTLSLRYLASPVTLATIVVGLIVALALLIVEGPQLAWIGLVPLVGYVITVVAGSIAIGGGLAFRARLWLPVVLTAMHLSWGAGYLFNLRRLTPRSP